MNSRNLFISALIMLWVNVPIFAFGAYLQIESPQFEEYRSIEFDRIHDQGSDSGGTDGLAFVFAGSWEIRTTVYCLLIGVITFPALLGFFLLDHNRAIGDQMSQPPGLGSNVLEVKMPVLAQLRLLADGLFNGVSIG